MCESKFASRKRVQFTTSVLLRPSRVIARSITSLRAREPPPKARLESVFCNNLLFSEGWSVKAVWGWRAFARINVLETEAALEHQDAVRSGGDGKLLLLLDSSVARGALGKGGRRPAFFARLFAKQLPAEYTSACSTRPPGSMFLTIPPGTLPSGLLRQEAILCCLALTRVCHPLCRVGFGLPLVYGSSPFTPCVPDPMQQSPSHDLPHAPKTSFDSTLGFPGEGPHSPQGTAKICLNRLHVRGLSSCMI